MYLLVPASGGVTLEDPDNFRAFKVVVGAPEATIDTVRMALAGIADVPGREFVWVSEAALRNWPNRAASTWQDGLSAMIAKARPHGWIDDVGRRIRAHVEWPTA